MKHKLPPEIKAQWVAALRSGDYKQGVERLWKRKYSDGEECYCCLGVLAEKINPGLLQGTKRYKGPHYDGFLDEQLTTNPDWCADHGLLVVLQQTTEDWYWSNLKFEPGMMHMFLPKGKLSSVEDVLMFANDQGVPFERIADLIEANL